MAGYLKLQVNNGQNKKSHEWTNFFAQMTQHKMEPNGVKQQAGGRSSRANKPAVLAALEQRFGC
ncbi:MAG: hypothetical protein MRY32_09340 [Rickettsiales bacterium]|nr:hypothetical protein [Rickettsiales bacterium]